MFGHLLAIWVTDSVTHVQIIGPVVWNSYIPGGSVVKNPTINARPGFNPWVGRYLGEGNGNPLQYSCLENPRHRGAWRAIVQGVPKNQTQLSG